ncbi:MAG: polysaccharide biosynthesis protein [Desulfobacteraceae bacterium]|nr:polysaccharide biosynthesis protein [Desulfobacteraceae bacterium]
MKLFDIEKWINHPIAISAVNRVLPFRFFINIILHCTIFILNYYYCIILLEGMIFDWTVIKFMGVPLLPLLAVKLIVFQWHDLYRGLWRYVSFEDLTNIIRAVIISSFTVYIMGLIWPLVAVAEELYILDAAFCILCCGGLRALVRNFREFYFQGAIGEKQKRILLVGPINRVQPILKDFLGDPLRRYIPLAVVDPGKKNYVNLVRICDVPVFTIDRLLKYKKHYKAADSIVICWPGSTRRQMDPLIDRLKSMSIPFKIIPHFEDILDNRVSISDIREVEIQDLLERDPVNLQMDKISAYLEGKTILVTGGAGSIGSEICRQVAAFKPKRLVVVERCENSLCDLIREFRRWFASIDLNATVSTVNDYQGLVAIMRKHKVDVVFHAAAYKHVPLMEKVPIEAAYNNIEGTYNAALAAIQAGVQRFVLISSDKAVNPTNVMGVTKRIAEMIVQSLSNNKTKFMTVRFGNVLGSAGSVIPLFKKLIKNGGPLTVTHKNIERFFMTIPEAVQLVLQAGCMGTGGEIFVLDMGKPVRILNLAEKLITLSGKRPYEDIDIVFTGLRPGEKMYEELFNSNEQHLPTSHPRIRSAVCNIVEAKFIEDQIFQIRKLIRAKKEKQLQDKFLELVPGYIPSEISGSTMPDSPQKIWVN